jgi:N-acetylmuramoyl-L-alanine amidase
VFCTRTHAAVLAFQQDYGLRPTGEVDESTWVGLIEASWALGERLLLLRSPNLRGDDVAELQALLSRMGFDCGRVDGIYGPRTSGAVTDFQTNVGLQPSGVCSPEEVRLLSQLSSQSGAGPGIAMVRQSVSLQEPLGDDVRLVLGFFPGLAALAHASEHRALAKHPLTTVVDSDARAQALAANQFQGDCYIGFEPSPDPGLVAYFYEVPSFTSVGGRHLARRIAESVSARIPEIPARAEGLRHPVLRETKMPAVLCSVGPPDLVSVKVNSLSAAVISAWEAWLREPSA